MQVMVTFRHVPPTKGLRSYAEEKVQRLSRFVPRAIEGHVILSVEKQRHRAEIQIIGKGLSVTATDETDDLYSAIDLTLAKVERQLQKHSEKLKKRKGSTSTANATAIAPERTPSRTMIHAQRVAVKPMSVDEAVLQLKVAKNDFMLFKNADSETLSVLYRRKDGSYGLLEPEPS